MNEIWQQGCCKPKSFFRIRLFGGSHNAVVGKGGMLYLLQRAFRHVTAAAIVWGAMAQPLLDRYEATGFGMAAQALLAIVLDLFSGCNLTMWVVASSATHLALAAKITSAQLQREVVLQEI